MKSHERPAMKTCKICNIEKEVTDFYARYARCKECHAKIQKICGDRYYKANSVRILERTKAYYHEKAEVYLTYKQNSRDANRERDAETRKIHRENNIDFCRARDTLTTAKRRALKCNAMPLWADIDKIRSIYIESQRITMETGIEHNVDHIIPLKGKLVCGLHVETNLRIITASENFKKSNKIIEEIV